MNIASIGIDLGKTSFHLVALDDHGKVVINKKFSRKQLLAYTANLPASTVNLNQDAVSLNPGVTDDLWNHTPGQWLADLGILLGIGLIVVVITYRRLAAIGARRRKQPA